MKTIRTRCTTAVVILALAAFATVGTAVVRAAGNSHEPTMGDKIANEMNDPKAAIYYAIAITVAVSCLSAGYAVGKVGAAALGAAAEKPELLGRAIIFVGLAEGIAIYGLIIGIMLILKL